MTALQLAWLGATFVGAALISLLLTPLIIRGASALRLYDAPDGVRDAEVLLRADALRRNAGDHHITEQHLADAIEALMTEGHGPGR